MEESNCCFLCRSKLEPLVPTTECQINSRRHETLRELLKQEGQTLSAEVVDPNAEETISFCSTCSQLLSDYQACREKLNQLRAKILRDLNKEFRPQTNHRDDDQVKDQVKDDDGIKKNSADPRRRLFEMTQTQFLEALTCPFCCQSFDNDPDFEAHDWQSHRKEESECSFACVECALKFRSFIARNHHFLVEHALDAPYPCGFCDKYFKVVKKRHLHEKVCPHSGNASRSHQCEVCAKNFSQARNLRDHINTAHALDKDEKKSFKCPECPKLFYKANNLKSHLLTHTDEKKFECVAQDCDLKFKRAKSLKCHVKLKHGNTDIRQLCTFCGKSFRSYSGLKLHLSKHTGEEYLKRKFVCDVCEKSFRSPFDLNLHSFVHTKNKPFKCSLCGNKFSQKAVLKDHLQIHMKTFQCSECQKCFARKRYLENHTRSCRQSNQISRGENSNVKMVEKPDLIETCDPGRRECLEQQSVSEQSAAEVLAQLTSRQVQPPGTFSSEISKP